MFIPVSGTIILNALECSIPGSRDLLEMWVTPLSGSTCASIRGWWWIPLRQLSSICTTMWRINVEITEDRVSLILPHRMTARLFQLFKSKKKIIANIDEDFTLYKSLCFAHFWLFDHFVDYKFHSERPFNNGKLSTSFSISCIFERPWIFVFEG